MSQVPPNPYAPPPPIPPYTQYPPHNPYSDANSKKIAAGICAILLGTFGIHKFILGNTTAGVITLLVSLLGGCVTLGIGAAVMHIIGIVEGIIYLTKTDEEFHRIYIANKKEWF